MNNSVDKDLFFLYSMGMDAETLRSILPVLEVISQGGLAIVVFVIWFFTFKKSSESIQHAIQKHEDLSKELLQILKEEQEYKAMLAGIMMRLEEKLKKPAACPIVRGEND
ncbi:hypothetical protein [Thermodesulfovibrio sp.]|uniref:hypothetical protein n=1 Tax=Thermodesulfovibrio sp. TaxID=2067987 RepID=UPI0030A0E01F